MAMAALNILSQPWPPTPSSLSFSNNNISFLTQCNAATATINSKLLSLSHSCHFSVLSSLYGTNRPNSSSKLSSMPTHLSKSGTLTAGTGCSWMQDNSMHHNDAADSECGEGPLHSAFPAKAAEISSIEDLYEFISSGPLMNKLGLAPEAVAESIDKWLAYGLHLCRLFQLKELDLSVPQKVRIYHYYLPVFFWCEDQISQHRSLYKDGEDIPPLVIGFSAPQGCGKTTLVFALDYLFKVTGRKSATISIDDFYLTAENQAKLREAHPGNALLELRGNAGSHDLPFSVETLTALSNLSKEGMKMKLPRYDKVTAPFNVKSAYSSFSFHFKTSFLVQIFSFELYPCCSLLTMERGTELILRHGPRWKGRLL
ncbi:hypothetical protein ABKV19_008973 [Rosa sericea]